MQGFQANSDEELLRLVKLGYLPASVRVTKVNAGPADTRYLAYLPERFNDLWASLRELGKVEVYADAPQDLVARVYPLMKDNKIRFVARIVRQGVVSSDRPNRGRYLVILPRMYAELWEAVHRAGAMLKLYFNINWGSESHGGPPQS